MNPDLLENCSANGELGHLQRSSNDGFNVSDVDLPRDVQSATGSAFDDISLLIAHRGFYREQFVGLFVHGGAEEV